VRRNNRSKLFQKKILKENSESAFGSTVGIEESVEEIARGNIHTGHVDTVIIRVKHIEFWSENRMERE
jgi:hypothetical protein